MELKLKIKFCFYHQMVTADSAPRARPTCEVSQGQRLGGIASLAQGLHAKSTRITKLNPIEAAA